MGDCVFAWDLQIIQLRKVYTLHLLCAVAARRRLLCALCNHCRCVWIHCKKCATLLGLAASVFCQLVCFVTISVNCIRYSAWFPVAFVFSFFHPMMLSVHFAGCVACVWAHPSVQQPCSFQLTGSCTRKPQKSPKFNSSAKMKSSTVKAKSSQTPTANPKRSRKLKALRIVNRTRQSLKIRSRCWPMMTEHWRSGTLVLEHFLRFFCDVLTTQCCMYALQPQRSFPFSLGAKQLLYLLHRELINTTNRNALVVHLSIANKRPS